jgi:hypothetical protein
MDEQLNALGDFYLGGLGPGGRMVLAMSSREIAARKVPHTLLMWIEHGAVKPPTSINWTAVAIVPAPWPQVDFAVIGAHGELLLLDASGGTRESSVARLLPSAQMMEVRSAATAHGSMWLVGGPGKVIEMPRSDVALDRSPPASTKPPGDSPLVFEAAAGLPGSRLLCTGWDGEIWVYERGRWAREESPTNLILTCIVPTPNGDAYLLGQAGSVLQGQPGRWSVLPQMIEENLWSAVWFDNTVHASSSQQLFVMDGNELCSVGLPEMPDSFHSLSVRGDAMLSTGAHDVLLLLPDRMERIV